MSSGIGLDFEPISIGIRPDPLPVSCYRILSEHTLTLICGRLHLGRFHSGCDTDCKNQVQETILDFMHPITTLGDSILRVKYLFMSPQSRVSSVDNLLVIHSDFSRSDNRLRRGDLRLRKGGCHATRKQQCFLWFLSLKSRLPPHPLV